MATRANSLVLPEVVPLAGVAESLTPNEMRALKDASGRTLTELLGGDPEDLDAGPDRVQALLWVALRRSGHDVSWEDAGDVRPDFTPAPPDPTNGG